jgi:tripartite-type tricarboxylate transporter receptor subunit TctC
LPPEIIKELNEATDQILDLPEVRKRLDVEGVEIQHMSPQALTKFVASENAKWGPVARSVR